MEELKRLSWGEEDLAKHRKGDEAMAKLARRLLRGNYYEFQMDRRTAEGGGWNLGVEFMVGARTGCPPVCASDNPPGGQPVGAPDRQVLNRTRHERARRCPQ